MSKIIVLKRLANVVTETIIEAIQKKPWTAYVNNTFTVSSVVFEHKHLVSDFLAVEKDQSLLDDLQTEVMNHPKLKELGEDKAARIFKNVWAMIIFNSRGVLEIKSIVEE
ncbi:hypothetical protein AB832_07910 [Flavobacteriaceae bacterium (ex Bugula neritina AB1)]|nr:hypothetical protein AB832_07910 [Flavobacteriaceae bacterium (ex Bugula neritina AB1)]